MSGAELMEDHYQRLTKLTMLLKSLYPSATTVHALSGSINKEGIYPEDLQVLYQMLVHSITLLNKLYRRQDKKGNYISQREDYATALMLVSPLFSIETMDLPESVRKYYQQLLTEIGLSKSFTWKDLQKITGKSKTRCNNILNHLQELNLVKQTSKGYKSIYNYEIIPLHEHIPTTSTWDEAMDQWQGFKGWENF